MLKSNVVDSEHLLLALFHNSEVQGLEIMEQFRNLGITYESIYKLLANVTDTPQMGASRSVVKAWLSGCDNRASRRCSALITLLL